MQNTVILALKKKYLDLYISMNSKEDQQQKKKTIVVYSKQVKLLPHASGWGRATGVHLHYR